MNAETISVKARAVLITLLFSLMPTSRVWASTTNPGRSEISDESLRELIRLQDDIRVFMTEAPGLGQQASTMSIIQRLRELGYRGKIDLIAEEAVALKLESFVPGFSARKGGTQIFPNLGLSVTVRKDSDPPVQPPVKWAISGGDDFAAFSARACQLGAEFYLALNPPGWASHLSRDQPQAARPAIVDLWISQATYRMPAASPNEKVLDGLPPKMRTGLQAIWDANARGQSEMCVAYGLENTSAWRLLQKLAQGFRVAHREGPQKLSKGVVVPLFGNVGNYSLQPLRPGLVSVDDPHLTEKIAALQPGETLFVEVGKVTPAVFDQFLLASRLPPTLHGRNTANFMRNLGRPYLASWDEELDSFKGFFEENALEKTGKSAVAAHRDFQHASRALLRDGSELILADFILQSLTPTSPVSQLFSQVGQTVRAQPDRVEEGLRRLLDGIRRTCFQAQTEAGLKKNDSMHD